MGLERHSRNPERIWNAGVQCKAVKRNYKLSTVETNIIWLLLIWNHVTDVVRKDHLIKLKSTELSGLVRDYYTT